MRSKNEPKSALKNSSQKGRCLGKKPIFRLLVIFLLSVFYFLPTVSFAGVLQKPPNNLGLVGYWSFNEATGTVVKDYSGNNNDGTTTSTIANPPTSTSGFTSGKRGNAMKFDGINDYVQVLNSPSLAITGDITIAGWIKKRIVANNNFFELFTKGNGTVFDYQFYICDNSSCGAGDRNKLQVWSDAPGIVLTGTTQILDTNWHHIAFTRSGTAITIYLDGVSNASGSNGTAFNNNTVNSQIGYDLSGAGAQTDGNIDEVRLYNRGLSATEIYALYKSGAAKVNAPQNTRLTSGLVGMWSFNGADTNWNTNTTKDVSGNGNTGTMTNMATSTTPAIGKVGQALTFGGANTSVTVANESNFDFSRTQPFSISTWIYRNTNNNEDDIVEKVDPASSYRGYALWLDNDTCYSGGCVKFELLGVNPSGCSVNGECISIRTTGDANTIPLKTWKHIVATYDGSSVAAGAKIYIDGALFPTELLFGGTLTTSILNNFSVLIGDDTTTDSCCQFDGRIDETRIYNRTLSAAEVKQLYLMGK